MSHALADAAAAERAGRTEASATALARALRAALAARLPEARHSTPEELLSGSSLSPLLRDALELLAAVEQARFDPSASAPERANVERAIAGLRLHKGT